MALFNTEELIGIAIALDEEEQDRQKVIRKKRRFWISELWQDRETVGEYHTIYRKLVNNSKAYHDYFKMSESSFHLLLQKLQNVLQKQDTNWRKAITPMERLVVCLRYLTTGDSFKTMSFNYRMGHSTIQNIVMETCKLITENLMTEMLPVPTEEKWKSIAEEYKTLWNFPNCLGAIDGKHFVIQAPPSSGSLYFNYKKTFSIVLLALVDANYNFVIVDVGAYGKNSDGGIFAKSNLGKQLQRKRLCVPEDTELPCTTNKVPYVIVGDEAFPLKSYLMRPFPGQNLDASQRIFNYRLSRARRVVENTFGQLTQKFRIYNRRIHALPKNVDNIILATCILHNFIKKYDNELPIVSNNTPLTNGAFEALPGQGGNATAEAFGVRELYKTYFNTIGIVPWQAHRM